MTDAEKLKLLQMVAAQHPMAGHLMQIAADGVQKLREDLEAQGVSGSINGVPFGPKPTEDALPTEIENSGQRGK